MKRFLRRMALILVVFVLVLITVAVAVVSAFEEPLGRRVIAEVNKQLTTELVVEGFDLAVLRTFPNVAATLQNVRLADTQEGSLLEARELSFRFGLLSLLTRKVNVKTVVIRDGALSIFIDREGKANYDIFVESEATEPAEEANGPTIALENARLENIYLSFQDQATDQDVGALVENAAFSGEFSSARYTLQSKAELLVKTVRIGEEEYAHEKPLTYQAKVDIDNEANRYTLTDVRVQLGQLAVETSGAIETRPNTTYFNLQLNSDEGTVGDVLSLLPGSYTEQLGDIESAGRFRLDGSIIGELGPSQNPKIETNIVLNDGRISSPRMKGAIKDVTFEAFFTNGAKQNNRTTVFELRRLKGYFQRQLYEMRLRVENLDDPLVDFVANGAMPMDVLMGFLPSDQIEDGSGEIEIAELRLKGRYGDMIRPQRADRVEASGAIVFDDASLTVKGNAIRLDRGQLRLDKNAFFFEDLRLIAPGTDVLFTGSAFGLIPVLFADSLNSQQAELEFEAQLTADELDIDQLLALSAPSEGELAEAEVSGTVDSLQEASVQIRERLTRFLRGTFQATIQDFNYYDIVGKNFQGEIAFLNSEMDINGRTEAMDGTFTIDGTAYFEEQPHLVAKITCDDVDIHAFFQQTGNFGQDVLTADNIYGDLDAKLVIEAYFDEAGNFLEDKLHVIAGIGLTDGRLRDLELMESFSSYVNIQDLRDIRFNDLQNFLEVRNRRLYLPVMFVQSNALNMTVSGEHSFDQDIDYNIKVNAGQVLAAKFKRHDPNLAPKPARRDGFFNLYYVIDGTIDDYNISAAKREVKSDFELSELRKRQVRQALEEAFRQPIELIEEPLPWRDIPEYEEDPNSDEPEFLDFEIGGSGKKSH